MGNGGATAYSDTKERNHVMFAVVSSTFATDYLVAPRKTGIGAVTRREGLYLAGMALLLVAPVVLRVIWGVN